MSAQNWIAIVSLAMALFSGLFAWIANRTLKQVDEAQKNQFERIGKLEQDTVRRVELQRLEDKLMDRFERLEDKLEAAIMSRRLSDGRPAS